MNNKLSNNELSKLKKLLLKKYRKEERKFIIEGKHLIEEALKHKGIIEMIITSNMDYKNESVQVKYCSYKAICSLSTTKSPQEYIAICNFIQPSKIKSNIVLALNKINDPGNLGTIIRTAFSFGIKEILVEGVDIYNSKVLRSTQGSIFNVNIKNTNNLLDNLINLKKENYKLIGSLLDKAQDYNEVEIHNEKIVIILGNEANGIEKNIIEILDYKVYIPIKFESLNVAIACGILLAKYCK